MASVVVMVFVDVGWVDEAGVASGDTGCAKGDAGCAKGDAGWLAAFTVLVVLVVVVTGCVAVAAGAVVAVGGTSVEGTAVGATVGSGVGVSSDPQAASPSVNSRQTVSPTIQCLSVENFIIVSFRSDSF